MDVTNTGNGERGTRNGQRATGNGQRATGNGQRATGNGQRATGNGQRGTGNGERGTGNGERGTGNGERGTGQWETGVWELVYSGNPLDNLIQNGGRRKREDSGRFPFDLKFRKFWVCERMEETFSGISFRNFGCTSRGWPKIPENRNNRKIPFHSTIPARA